MFLVGQGQRASSGKALGGGFKKREGQISYSVLKLLHLIIKKNSVLGFHYDETAEVINL